MFGNYSKLVAAIIGNVVALLIAYIATMVPAIATCVDTGGTTTCSVFGLDQNEITIFLMGVLNTAFVYFFPPNIPRAK